MHAPASMPHTLLHVFSTFAVGGPQVRFATLASQHGARFRHRVLAVDGRYQCLERVDPSVDCAAVEPVPERGSLPANVRSALAAIRQLKPDLVLTYNWGAIEWSVAATLARQSHIHVADGFGPEEAARQLRRRVLFRRLALRKCAKVVVPSLTLERTARDCWRLPAERIAYVPNGIDVARFHRPPDDALLARLDIPRDRAVVGTVCALRPEKNLPRLLRAAQWMMLARVPFTLVIVGEGEERPYLETLTRQFGIQSYVRFVGALDEPARILGAFDVFALSSDTEQMPLTVVEAMAAGLPIAAVDVGDVKAMVGDRNRRFVVSPNEQELANVLHELVRDRDLRAQIGAENRDVATRRYAVAGMAARYAEVMEEAMRLRQPALAA